MVAFKGTALADRPDIAANIGLIVADYTLIEHLHFLVYALLSKLDGKIAFQNFYSIISINKRCELITAAAHAKGGNWPVVMKRINRRMRGASRRRTDIIHCWYAITPNGTTAWAVETAHGMASYKPVDESLFNRTRDQFHALGADLVCIAAHAQSDPLSMSGLLSSLPRPPGVEALAENPQLGPPDPREEAEIEARAKALGLFA